MKQICGDCLHYYACAAWNIGSLANTEAESCVNYTPTADVVEVVRCKDCKYSYDGVSSWCCSYGVFAGCIMPGDFYCKCGKRRRANDDR